MLYVLILWLSSLIQPICAFCLEYVSNLCITFLLKMIVHPKIKILMSSHMFDFFFSDEHKQRFLVRVMQGDRTTSETTQSEHDDQV